MRSERALERDNVETPFAQQSLALDQQQFDRLEHPTQARLRGRVSTLALISRKKRVNPVGDGLLDYLARNRRTIELPVTFEDLGRYVDSIPVYNKDGEDTLWETAIYPPTERALILDGLVQTYALLKVVGDRRFMRHLVADRIDICAWGNTNPFRVRILNTLNDNHDYIYIKKADASRIYGLELEHLLSPHRIDFLTDGKTVVEEHVSGIPGENFIAQYLDDKNLNEVRLAKEFVKFNERCIVRLLGDMHAGNYVVDVTPDLDNVAYTLRAMDFDQQSYDGRCRVYLPQYYRQNNPIVFLGMRTMTKETFKQYREEERVLIGHRAEMEHERLRHLLSIMEADDLAPIENVHKLRGELGQHWKTDVFGRCESMGALVRASLGLVTNRPIV